MTEKYFQQLAKAGGRAQLSSASQNDLIAAVQQGGNRINNIQFFKHLLNTKSESQAEAWYNRLREMLSEREKPYSAELHHLMTIENTKASAAGGPYTPLFEALAEQRGWSLDAKGSRLNHGDNLVELAWHQGPHAEYNRVVYEMMISATGGKTGAAFNTAFDAALKVISKETLKPGSKLNKLATGLK